MKNKFVAALVVFATLAGFMSLSAASFAQQADSEEYNKSTPWGDPDLQGNWSYASLTPLQRPQRLGEKIRALRWRDKRFYRLRVRGESEQQLLRRHRDDARPHPHGSTGVIMGRTR